MWQNQELIFNQYCLASIPQKIVELSCGGSSSSSCQEQPKQDKTTKSQIGIKLIKQG
ncbi:MAG: hypothetical protein AAGE84_01270 [Cyanobacteria bacterium P01_G01_bin.39]